jgi:hypothetical protein
MSSFYDKNLLNNNKNNNQSNKYNILKKDFTLDYSDYDKLNISKQYNKLYSNIYNKNQLDIEINENKKIYNLSFNTLINNSGKVYINILNDLSIFFSENNKNKNFNTLGIILVKDDNLIYIGILFLILSFLLWLINITS